MSYNPEIHQRQSIRLKAYDYSQPGWYFLTLCTHDRRPIFGHVAGGKMILNNGGQVAHQCWLEIPDHFPQAVLDEFVVMPDHVHGIIEIVGNDCQKNEILGAKNISPPQNFSPQIFPPQNFSPQGFHSPSQTIGSMIRGFKIGVTKWFRKHTTVDVVWQRNYYDHIVRDTAALDRIRKYIRENPAKWYEDGINHS